MGTRQFAVLLPQLLLTALTRRSFRRAVGLLALTFCPGAVPVASLMPFSFQVRIGAGSSSSEPEPTESSSCIVAFGSSSRRARSADESVRWKWRMTLMRWTCSEWVSLLSLEC